jgi:hypothetical protein
VSNRAITYKKAGMNAAVSAAVFNRRYLPPQPERHVVLSRALLRRGARISLLARGAI